VYSAGREYEPDSPTSPEWEQFDGLLHQARTEYHFGNTEAAENRIDEIWIQFRSKVSSHPEAVSGYVNALILLGFAGTLFGSFMALFEMGGVLTRASVVERIAGTAGILRDALSLAMLTSLVSSAIGCAVITYLCLGFLNRWVNRTASILNEQIYRIYETDTQSKDASSIDDSNETA